MSITLVNQVRKQANQIGYKPRFGITVEDMIINFSRGESFDVQIDINADGRTNAGAPTKFEDDVGIDVDDLIVGDDLNILSGANAGTYPITGIFPTYIICSSASFSTVSGQGWTITRNFQDLLKKKPSIKFSSSQFGGYAPQTDLSFGIMNEGLFSDIFATYPDPEHGPCNASLYFDDGTAIRLTEGIDLYSGTIKTFPVVNYDSVNFRSSDPDILKGRVIGTIITTAEAADGELLPANSFGKMKPIIYGDHRTHIGDTTTADINLTRKENLVPCIYLGVDEAKKHRWMISAHKVYGVEEMWGFDEEIERMVKLKTFTVEENDDTLGCIISVATGAVFYDYWYPTGLTNFDAQTGTPVVTNRDDAADKNKSTKATTACADGGTPEDYEYGVEFAAWDNEKVDNTDIIEVRTYSNTMFSTTGTDAVFTISGSDVKAQVHATYFSQVLTASTQIAINADMAVRCTASTDGVDVTIASTYQMFKRIEYLPIEPNLTLFFGGRGREYGAWINSRTQTEAHIDNNNAGDLIENAAGVEESLLRDELGFVDATLNLGSFNISSNDLSTTEISSSIIKQINWTEPVTKLAQASKSLLNYDHDSKLRMTVFGGIAGFSASGKTVPNNWDIYESSPVATFKIITGYNDKLYVGIHTFTLRAGEYTGSGLEGEINTQFNPTFFGDVEITYTTATGLFEFEDSGALGPLAMKWSTGGVQNVGRFIGFDISADDVLPIGGTLTSDFGLWDDSWFENPIAAGSFSIGRQSEDIITDVTVDYYPNMDDLAQSESQDTDTTYNTDLVGNSWKHPFTRDPVTAALYRDFILDRLAKRHWVARFKTYMNAIHLEQWDIINIRDPLIEGIFTSAVMDAKEWIVLDITIDNSKFEIGITAIEI